MTTEVTSTHACFYFILKLAQCCGMLPVSGISSQNYKSLNFRWTAKRTIYSVLFFILAFLNATFQVTKMVKSKTFDFGQLVTFFFFLVTAITVAIFLDVARKWPNLMKKWSEVDDTLKTRYGFPPSLYPTLKRVTTVVITAAIVEHSLFLSFMIKNSQKADTVGETIQLYFKNSFDQIFSVVPYSIPLAVIVQLVNTFSTISWNFMDLFIILISLALSARFEQVVSKTRSLTNLRVSNKIFWRVVREDYTRLVNLCEVVDDAISTIVLVSFGNNIFVVVVQLYYTLQRPPSSGIVDKIYYVYSFSFLILRTLGIIVYVARVNSESKKPLQHLNTALVKVYNTEIERFFFQVKYNTTALTGHKLFKVTKSLILHIAGAIVSYELILIEFSD